MSELTGLPTNEVALLRSLRQVAGISGTARTSDVMAAVDRAGVMGPRAAQQTLIDLIAPWRRQLPLVRGDGNWGSQGGDPPADPEYTEVGLTRYGEFALAAEEGSLGPVPLGLIDGSWYRGGQQPPYEPRAVLQALRHGDAAGLVPTPPTGGHVSGNFTAWPRGGPPASLCQPRPSSSTGSRHRPSLLKRRPGRMEPGHLDDAPPQVGRRSRGGHRDPAPSHPPALAEVPSPRFATTRQKTAESA